MRTSTRLIVAVALALVVSACGADSEGGDSQPTDETTTTVTPIDPTSTTTPPLAEARLLLRFDGSGGFVPVEYALTDLIQFSLYSDGRVVLGPFSDGFPLASVRQYTETTIDELTLVEFLGFIEQLGIENFDNESNDEMTSVVADAETITIEYFDEDGGVHTYSVYALGMSDFVDADGRVAVAKKIAELVESIDGGDAVAIPTERLRVWVSEATPDPSFHKMRDWEFAFPTIRADNEGFPYSCFELSGDAAAATIALLDTADSTTLWDEGGSAYSVLAKPLLEGEPGCEDGF